MAIFKTINQIEDFWKIGSVLNDAYNINGELYNDLANSKNIIEDLWDTCLEKCKSLLYLKDGCKYLKLLLGADKNRAFNASYIQIIKEHIIFSAYYTLSCLSYEKLVSSDNKEVMFFQLHSYLVGEITNNSRTSYDEQEQNAIASFTEKIRNNYRSLINEPVCEYLKNALGVSGNFGYNCIDPAAFYLLVDILDTWDTSPYNPKYHPNDKGKKTTFYYKNYTQNKEALIRHNETLQSDSVKSYLLERIMNFAFIDEVMVILAQLAESDSDKDYYLIPRVGSDLYASEDLMEQVDGSDNLFIDKILIKGDSTPVANASFSDSTINVRFNKPEKKCVQIAKHGKVLNPFFKVLSSFAALPNALSRKKFIYFAINLYYNYYKEDLYVWEREMELFIEQLTLFTFPALEGCYLSLLFKYFPNRDANEDFDIEEAKNLLLDYMKQHNMLPDSDAPVSINNPIQINADNKDELSKAKNKVCLEILSTIYHNIMLDVSQNSNFYTLVADDPELKEALRKHLDSLE